jgi:hypothetical protein
VLARTWGAPEMPRPGCVWTHSLIIEFADLATIQTTGGLLRLFRKPDGRPPPSEYHEPLQAPVGNVADYADAPLQRTASIVNALYSEPSKKIIAKTTDAISDETLLLAVWMQQWPRLRRAFRFCSKAGADRSTKSEIFDLQLVPAMDRVHRARFFDALDAEEARGNLQLTPLIDDLRQPGPSKLRRFLRQVGGDVVGGRSSMAGLCRLFVAIEHKEGETSLNEAVEILDSFGPSQARAARTMVVKRASELTREADKPEAAARSANMGP